MEDVALKTTAAQNLIAPLHAQRAQAPAEVWDWQDFNSWCDVIWDLLAEIVSEDVRAEFLRSPPEYLVSDDLSWLDDIIFDVKERWVDSKERLTNRIREHFQAFRAAHGTRTEDVSSFYQHGLYPHAPEKIHDRARKIFLSGDFPELTLEKINAAILELDNKIDVGKVFFTANEAKLIETSGHYMLYGSEHVTAIAAHLGGCRDYRQVLKGIGLPTIFVCDIPISLIGSGTLNEFAGLAIERVFHELLYGEDASWASMSDAALCIHHRLPPECIVGHYHPKRIHDPLLGF